MVAANARSRSSSAVSAAGPRRGAGRSRSSRRRQQPRQQRRHAHAGGRRHRLGQDRHPDVDRDVGRSRRGMAAIVVDPKGDRWHARAGCHARGARRRAGRFIHVDAAGAGGVQPVRARRGDRDRRQGARGGALHRAPLPAPGAALPRARSTRAAGRRAGGEPRGRSSRRSIPRGWSCSRASCRRSARGRVHAYLDSLTPPSAQRPGGRARPPGDHGGVRRRARGSIPPRAGAERFDLLEAVRTGRSCYFSLQADRRPLLAQMLGSAIVQDLQTVVSALQERPARCARGDRRVLRDRRGARGAALRPGALGGDQPAARHPGALRPASAGSRDAAGAGARQPHGVIAHRQAVPASAELIARLAGSRGAWRTTRQQRRPEHPHAGQRAPDRRRGGDEPPARAGGRDPAQQPTQRRDRADALAGDSPETTTTKEDRDDLCLHQHQAPTAPPTPRASRAHALGGGSRRSHGRGRWPSAWASASPRRAARLLAAERERLLERHRPLTGRPALYTATRAGLRAAGVRGLDPCRVSASNALHLIECARVAAALERCYPDHRVQGERELRSEERERGGALAGARSAVGTRRRAAPPLHRPDLVLWPSGPDGGLPVAVEVELTVKAPRAPGGDLPWRGRGRAAWPACCTSPRPRCERAAAARDRPRARRRAGVGRPARRAAHAVGGAERAYRPKR